MPRASDGSYSLPAGSLVNVGEDIVPSQHNPPLTDIAQALTGSVSRDGLGGMRNNLSMGGFRVTNLAPGVQPTDAATVSQISGLSGVPIGFIGDWPSATPPTGWLICAGQTLSRTDYAALFAVVGTAFGSPSGSTFQLPDYRGRVSAGLDVDAGGFADRLTTPSSRTIGGAGGAQSITLTIDQMPKHGHPISATAESAGAHTHSIPFVEGNYRGGLPDGVSGLASGNTGSAGAHTHNISGTANEMGGGLAHSNVQPTIIMNKIIKASTT